MFYSQQIESAEYEASYNPQDKFAGFDRGDIGHADEEFWCNEACVYDVTLASCDMLEVWLCESTYEVRLASATVGRFSDRRAAWSCCKWWIAGCPA